MAEYVSGEPMAVGVGDPITFENKTDDSFSVDVGIVFRKSGLYRVSVVGKHTSVEIEPERKKGKWIKKMRVTETEKYISYDPEWYCACCGTKYDPHVAKTVNFCYVCGVDMRGEQDDEQ